MAENHAHGGTRKIWIVFWILLVVTTVEVALGLIQPEFLMADHIGTSWLNVTFILLTLVKAFYIVEYFMHLKHETRAVRWTIYLPVLILIPYLTFILLMEGAYMLEMMQ